MVNKMNITKYLDKKKYFEFYIVNINKKDPSYNDIIDVFKEAIVNPFIVDDNDHVIIVSTILNNDINQLVNALIDDFGLKLKVFKSNKISVDNVEYLEILKKLYYKYETSFNDNYITLKNLAQIILEKDINDLQYIKPIIINKIMNDPKLFEIINGMFVNDLNVCKTANYVYMHRNTINNKLAIIKEETGLDIQKFQEAVILYALVKR